MPPPQSEMTETNEANGEAGQAESTGEMVCVYCYRSACEGCPLRFDDKITLRKILD